MKLASEQRVELSNNSWLSKRRLTVAGTQSDLHIGVRESLFSLVYKDGFLCSRVPNEYLEKKQHGDKQAGTLVTCRSLNAPIQSAPRSAPTPSHLLQKHSISLIAPAPPPMCKELLECEPCIRRE